MHFVGLYCINIVFFYCMNKQVIYHNKLSEKLQQIS